MAKFDTAKLLAHLKVKWANRPCPMCGVQQWTAPESTFQLMEFNPNAGLVIGGQLVPVVPVACTNCGNTVLVNAIVVGLVKAVHEKTP